MRLITCPKCGSNHILIQVLSIDIPKYSYKCLICNYEFDTVGKKINNL